MATVATDSSEKVLQKILFEEQLPVSQVCS